MQFFRLIGILVIFSSIGYGQSELQWSKSYNTKLPEYYSDNPQVESKEDSLIIVTGRCNTDSGQSLLKIHYNLNGDTIITKKFGLDSVNENYIVDYEYDSLGNLYILSEDKLEYYKSRILLQKYAQDGSLLWVRKIHSLADTSYRANSLGLLSDTCLIIAGYKEYDYPPPGSHVVTTVTIPYLYAYNVKGDIFLERKLNKYTELNSFLEDLVIMTDTAYLFGFDQSFDYKLLKVTADLGVRSEQKLNIQKGVNHVEFTPDNKLLIASSTEYRLTKLKLNGQIIWSVFYGTNLPGNVSGDKIKALKQDSAGNIYVTGGHRGDQYGTPAYSNADILTLKYDSTGQLIWQNRYEHLGKNADVANSLGLRNGEVYVGGNSQANGISTDYDYVLLKMDATTGQSNGEYRYDEAGGDDVITHVQILNDKRVLITGLTFNGSSYSQTTQLLGATFSTGDIADLQDVQIYPNPVSQGSKLKLHNDDFTAYEVITLDGQVVTMGRLEPDINNIAIYKISPGTYILKLLKGETSHCQKFVVK